MVILYGIDGQVISNHNTQDKAFWCKAGETLEASFVGLHGNYLNYSINPAKKIDSYAPDLVNLDTNRLADLKVQQMPFFKAKQLYGIEPTYAVVFNEKDRLRYERYYPDIEIVYWIDWVAVKADIRGRIFEVTPFKGVFRASFREMVKYLDTLAIHYYQQRVADELGNAKGSYVLDIRNPVFKRLA